jgi:dolichol-phosphate mannosyltransferase
LRFSIVVPALNEAENVAPLAAEIAGALDGAYPGAYELIFVDDGSTDETAQRVRAERAARPQLRLVRHERRAGQSAAIRSGVKAARAPWIVTLDGDGQNDPADIPQLLDMAWQGGEAARRMVGGLRLKRRDTRSRRLATRVANAVRQSVLKDGCSDTGCSLKAFPRDAFLDLPYFNSLHRFLPAMFQSYGIETRFVEVNHRPRLRGSTKYTNWRRALIGIADLRGVLWLKRRTVLPGSVTEE